MYTGGRESIAKGVGTEEYDEDGELTLDKYSKKLYVSERFIHSRKTINNRRNILFHAKDRQLKHVLS